MGMAASQARFLGLTGRKSNTEYQGQQVNQQRSSLANESAGLFNQMTALKVPLPPSSIDYYSSRYKFSDSTEDNIFSLKNIGAVGKDGKTVVDIVYNRTVNAATPANIEMYDINKKGENYTITDKNDKNKSFTFIQLAKDKDGNYFNGTQDADGKITGTDYTTQVKDIQDRHGANYYNDTTRKAADEKFYVVPMSAGDIRIISSYDLADMGIKEGNNILSADSSIKAYKTKTVTKSEIYSANATISSEGGTGMYTGIRFDEKDNKDMPKELLPYANKVQELSIGKVNDSEGYEQAMKDYEYAKMIYDRSIDDINSRTEVIQQQDKGLELKLKQLDTEQKAIQTEMEAVQKVIQKNVETTFKTFG